eukprot:12051337-Ditylum_brightwellii.AAC.1
MFKEEWGGLGPVATKTIFAWLKQEEEGKPDEVEAIIVVEDVHKYGTDAAGGGVFMLVGAELVMEAEVDVPQMIFSGVRDPHAGKD